jgi:hypothetical protein
VTLPYCLGQIYKVFILDSELWILYSVPTINFSKIPLVFSGLRGSPLIYFIYPGFERTTREQVDFVRKMIMMGKFDMFLIIFSTDIRVQTLDLSVHGMRST